MFRVNNSLSFHHHHRLYIILSLLFSPSFQVEICFLKHSYAATISGWFQYRQKSQRRWFCQNAQKRKWWRFSFSCVVWGQIHSEISCVLFQSLKKKKHFFMLENVAQTKSMDVVFIWTILLQLALARLHLLILEDLCGGKIIPQQSG